MITLEPTKNDAHLNKNMSVKNYSLCLESDENDDYDTDCSISSMDYLPVCLKKNIKITNFDHINNVDKKQIENANLKKAEKTKNLTEKKVYHTIDDENLLQIFKKNSSDFYGKLKSVMQHQSSKIRLNKMQKLNTEFSELNTSESYKWSIYKFKQNNINRSCISLKNLKNHKQLINQKGMIPQNKLPKNKNLIRNQLKKPMPLLQFNYKIVLGMVQTNEKPNKYLLPNNAEKFVQNKMDHFIDCETTTLKENHYLEYHNNNIEDQLFESMHFDDFIDKDYENFKMQIEDIIKQLFQEDDYSRKNIVDQ